MYIHTTILWVYVQFLISFFLPFASKNSRSDSEPDPIAMVSSAHSGRVECMESFEPVDANLSKVLRVLSPPLVTTAALVSDIFLVRTFLEAPLLSPRLTSHEFRFLSHSVLLTLLSNEPWPCRLDLRDTGMSFVEVWRFSCPLATGVSLWAELVDPFVSAGSGSTTWLAVDSAPSSSSSSPISSSTTRPSFRCKMSWVHEIWYYNFNIHHYKNNQW